MVAATLDAIRTALSQVEDPEVPVTLADLGVLRAVAMIDGRVRVTLVPTRLGCPGRGEMERRVRHAVKDAAPHLTVDVEWQMTAWDERDITECGRQVLGEAGYVAGVGAAPVCPYCSSERIERTAEFGGSLCKVPYACQSCGSTFDALRGTRLPVHP